MLGPRVRGIGMGVYCLDFLGVYNIISRMWEPYGNMIIYKYCNF